jgi:ribosomal-protein-alanine N-acetyltransferase
MPGLQTERLTLAPFGLELVRAAMTDRAALGRLLSVRVPADWPGPDLGEILPLIAAGLGEDPARARWGGLIIHTADRTLIGDIGCKEPPDAAGMVEIGYSIVPAYWGRGYATEAARALVAWLWTQGVRRVTAECLDDNAASIRVLEKLGMRRLPPVGDMLKWEMRRGPR